MESPFGTVKWDQDELQKLIDDEIQENQFTEYKRAEALGKTDGKKREITKDVAAMANAVGGTIFYGIAEHDTPQMRHLPANIDAIDQQQFSREWLRQVINNIQPRIADIRIEPVTVNNNNTQVVYVVEIPESKTAHQSQDGRYYRRYGTEIRWMPDFEVREVMTRAQYPKIELDFNVESGPSEKYNMLQIWAKNTGQIYGQYINGVVECPEALVHPDVRNSLKSIQRDGQRFLQFQIDNTVQDITRRSTGGGSGFLASPYEPAEYGPRRYEPLLPGLSTCLREIYIQDEWHALRRLGGSIYWTVHCDNAGAMSGEYAVLHLETNQE